MQTNNRSIITDRYKKSNCFLDRLIQTKLIDEFVNLTTPRRNKQTPYEPTPNLIIQGLNANHNENVQSGYMNFYEPQILDKNQGITSKNATPLQSGRGEPVETEQKIGINYSQFLEYRTEILARKDIIHQIWLMRKVGINY